jgi:PAS domain S-box-containing protein
MITSAPSEAVADLVDRIALIVCGLDRGGTIVAANETCGRVTGLGEAVIGRAWCEIFASAERADHVTRLWEAVTPHRGSDEFEALCRNGRRLRWQFSHWSVDHDAALCAVGVDITEERDRLARRRGLERVTALANLGAGLAHELRNPLNSASLQLTLAERKLARFAPPVAVGLAEPIAHALREIERAAALLEDFLAFARPQQLVPARVDVEVIVERAIARVHPHAAIGGVRIAIAAAAPLTAELDAARVEGALVQLLKNAIDAAADARAAEVTVRWHNDGNAVILEVADRGAGLPSESAPIFDPFFTTKPAGTGLGLAIVERVAHDHGGTVEVERVDGETVFRLRLPLFAGAL